MDDWIDYYDSTHTIYVSKRHRDLHFQVIARDIIGYISSAEAVVLDYACGEALSAARVAEACGKLYLAEPAPGVRGRLIARFAPNMKIRVRSLDDLRKMAEQSVDLARRRLSQPCAVGGSAEYQRLLMLTDEELSAAEPNSPDSTAQRLRRSLDILRGDVWPWVATAEQDRRLKREEVLQ